MKRRNNQMGQMGAVLVNAIHDSEEWQKTQSQIDATVEKSRLRREKQLRDWEEGERIIRSIEARYAERHRRREARERQERERIRILEAFWKQRWGFGPVRLDNNGSIPRDERGVANLIMQKRAIHGKNGTTKTLLAPIVNPEMERLLACFMSQRLNS